MSDRSETQLVLRILRSLTLPARQARAIMDDRTALMAAIVSNPAEDTPRLALADWLQEHGDAHDRARAEHIRLQIEYDSLPATASSRKKLLRRAVSIQKKHAEHWLGPLTEIFRSTGFDIDQDDTFRRGLLYWWFESPKRFLQKAHQKAVCEWFPRVGVNRLHLNGGGSADAVASSPALAWLPAFEWDDGKIDDGGLSALATSPYFTRLNAFGLDETKLTDRGLTAFAASAKMPNLRRLHLRAGKRGSYTAAGLLAVVGSKRFPALRDLDIDCDQPKSLDYKKLFADPRVKRLKRLTIGWKGDIAAAVRSPNLSGLEELGGNEVAFTDADADALIANPALANLKRFTLETRNDSIKPGVMKKLRARFGDGLTSAFA